MLHARNVLTAGTSVANSTAAGFSIGAPAGWETYEVWQGNADLAWWGQVWGSDQTVNCVGIAAHTLGSTGSSVRIDSYDGTSWTARQGVQAPVDDSPIMWMFDDETARGFRVWVSAGSARPELGVVRFGSALEMPQSVFAGGSPGRWGRNTVFQSFRSETGATLGRTVERTNLSGSFRMRHLTPAWVDANWNAAALALEEAPFFLAWRPDTSQGATAFGDVVFGEVTQAPERQFMGVRDLIETSFDWVGPSYE